MSDPIRKSCQESSCRDLSGKNLACKQDLTRRDKILEQECCQIGKITTALARFWNKSYHILSILANSCRILQDFFDRATFFTFHTTQSLGMRLVGSSLGHATTPPRISQQEDGFFFLQDLIRKL